MNERQHLHNRIGNCIGEARKRMLDRLKSGADLDDSIAVFIAEARLGLQTIARDEAESKNLNSESVQHST